ncbi:hypothetical protein KNE206_32720 [Kitasatospora sp. NE20-6]|uniref:nuclear transport factor 2 family protein n=1 Tax=Kitasatospora sp. NE20-6 TaxID=2859066 RepID=UPI0034DC5C4A
MNPADPGPADPAYAYADAAYAAYAAAVTQLVLHERQSRDRGRWDVMRACFAPDSTVRVSWFRGTGADFVTESQKMAERGDTATHRLSPPVVDVHGDRALAEVPAAIEVRTLLDGVEVDVTSRTRILYRAERREGRWLIVSVDPVYESDTLATSLPGTRLTVDAEELAAFRPPYRMLAHVLSRRGYRIGDDLYGDDRPQDSAALYASAVAWARTRT